MTVYIPAKDVAKLVRAELKETFPDTRFSVRTDHGTTLNIEWTDGPATKTVDDLTDKYAGQGFDGMTDMRYSRDNAGTTPDGEQIRYCTDFVFTRRNVSDEEDHRLRTLLANEIAEENGTSFAAALLSTTYWPAPQTIMREANTAQPQSLYVFVRILAEARAAVTA